MLIYIYNNRDILHKNSKKKIRILQSLMKIPISKNIENQKIISAEKIDKKKKIINKIMMMNGFSKIAFREKETKMIIF